jgi:hypothetical protein
MQRASDFKVHLPITVLPLGGRAPEVGKMMTQWASEGKTVLSVVPEGVLLGALAAED